jgi:hypothetical protein
MIESDWEFKNNNNGADANGLTVINNNGIGSCTYNVRTTNLYDSKKIIIHLPFVGYELLFIRGNYS